MMYGMAEDKALPKQLLYTTPSGVPGLAIVLATFFAMILVFFGDLALVARISVSGMFIIFIIDNLSVVMLRLKKLNLERPFKIPFSIANVPIIPLLATLLMVGFLTYEFISDPMMLLGFFGLAAVGLVLNESEHWLTGD